MHEMLVGGAASFAWLSEKIKRIGVLPRVRVLAIGAKEGDTTAPHSFSVGRFDVVHVARVEHLGDVATLSRNVDLILITTSNNLDEELRLWRLREDYPNALLAAWTWDNHHHFTQNLRVVIGADMIFPGHWADHAYLATVRSVVGPHLPLCAHQFTSQTVARTYPGGLPADRSDALFGGFFAYPFARKRNDFIAAVRDAIPANAIEQVDPAAPYFAKPTQARLTEWCAHKVGLVVPINRDLSNRLFECLVTGQVPLVARDVPDLDALIPAAVQNMLPVIRFDDGSVESVRHGYAEALARFNEGGMQGMQLRHDYARQHHEIDSRVVRVSQFFENFDRIELVNDRGALRPYAFETTR